MPNAELDGFTGPRQKIDIRYEFGLKVIWFQMLKGADRDLCSHFLVNFQAAINFAVVSVRLILLKFGVDGFTEPRRESDVR